MSDQVTGQVSGSAAQVYEDFFVPNLFKIWTEPVLEVAKLSPGQSVLDVACGTGILAREAYKKVQPGGTSSGLDLNEGMLDVARGVAPELEWVEASVESIPFKDEKFDAVVSQFGLMFFENKSVALAEMWRILKKGGRLTVAVWDALERSPGYLEFTNLLEKLFGEKVSNELKAPYSLGDKGELALLFQQSGISEPIIKTVECPSYYPSMEKWMEMDVKGWTIGDMISDDDYNLLLNRAHKDLGHMVQDDGRVKFNSPAHIVSAMKT